MILQEMTLQDIMLSIVIPAICGVSIYQWIKYKSKYLSRGWEIDMLNRIILNMKPISERTREDWEIILGKPPKNADELDADLIDSDSITCPQCNMSSHNPNDIKFSYCSNCRTDHSAIKTDDIWKEE